MDKAELRSRTQSILDELPEDTSWDDLMYRIYVRQKIEKGIKSAGEEAPRTADEIRRSPGVSSRRVPEYDDPKLREVLCDNFRVIYRITHQIISTGRHFFPVTLMM